MPCERFTHNGMNGFICYNNEVEHEYQGRVYRWEKTYSVPLPLRADGEPSKRHPKGFWEAVEDYETNRNNETARE